MNEQELNAKADKVLAIMDDYKRQGKDASTEIEKMRLRRTQVGTYNHETGEHKAIDEPKLHMDAINNSIEAHTKVFLEVGYKQLEKEASKRAKDALAKNISVKDTFRLVKNFYTNRKFAADKANENATKIVGSIIRVGRDQDLGSGRFGTSESEIQKPDDYYKLMNECVRRNAALPIVKQEPTDVVMKRCREEAGRASRIFPEERSIKKSDSRSFDSASGAYIPNEAQKIKNRAQSVKRDHWKPGQRISTYDDRIRELGFDCGLSGQEISQMSHDSVKRYAISKLGHVHVRKALKG